MHHAVYRYIFLFLTQAVFVLCLSQICFSEDNNNSSENPRAGVLQSKEAEKTLASLSDEQVRALLITELSKNVPSDDTLSENRMKGPAGIFHVMLRKLSGEHDESIRQVEKLLSGIPHVIPDLSRVFIQLCPYGTSRGAMLNIFWVFFFLISGALIELIFRKTFLTRLFVTLNDADSDRMTNIDKFTASVTKILPDIFGLVVFFFAAYIAFIVFIWTDSPYVQLFFFATLIAVCVIRVTIIVFRIMFSPHIASFRILPMECPAALKSYRLLIWTTGYIVVTLMFTVVARRLGAEILTTRIMQLFAATLLLAVSAAAVILYREKIHEYIINEGLNEDQSLTWGRKQFAAIWHIFALTYLLVLWLLLLDNLADTSVKNSGAFILSFFVVPIWMVFDRVVQWIVRYAMNILKIHQETYDDLPPPGEEEIIERQKGKNLYIRVKSFARVCVIGAVFIWLANLWHIRIPFFSELAGIMLDGLIIMTLAMLLWQAISSWIERKIQESLPEEEEEDSRDDEWGGAASRGRAYTLLPMIRKFIGTVLVVMVTMTILSSMGVDIGPLLAGAGVIGLAIGFGAQKLVADMFSGFFYLLDDAFRVGEYLTASSVSGTVESITLRNIMLRHHRGMLQIVPHSELGAITNYMRGGIIVKFNLDFPYDAPIDKIRKIIKKVGQKMLENEEYGKDFIRPVKSQGVREITNSVMTIRVKFTAQPGTHFVIRREAYRLITEALNEQSIYYAHKKVIVDLPELETSTENSTEVKKQMTHAAAAAAQRVLEEDEKEDTKPTALSNDAMG